MVIVYQLKSQLIIALIGFVQAKRQGFSQPNQPVGQYYIFEKSSLKNQVEQTGSLVYFELDFCRPHKQKKSSSKQTKIQFSNLIFQTRYFKIQLQIHNHFWPSKISWAGPKPFEHRSKHKLKQRKDTFLNQNKE